MVIWERRIFSWDWIAGPASARRSISAILLHLSERSSGLLLKPFWHCRGFVASSPILRTDLRRVFIVASSSCDPVTVALPVVFVQRTVILSFPPSSSSGKSFQLFAL